MAVFLTQGQIVMHPDIVAEIALGSLRNRHQRLTQLDALLSVTVASVAVVRHMIEAHSLFSRGIGLTDAHLLASCLLTPGTLLWTRDSRLEKVAADLGVSSNLP